METFLITLGIVYAIIIATTFIVSLSIKFDKDHNANVNSWHYRLFCFISGTDRYTYITKPPRTVCSYFWQYVTFMLMLPLSLPYLIIVSIWPDSKEDGRTPLPILLGMLTYIAGFFVWMVGMGTLESFALFTDPNWFQLTILPLITGAIIITTVVSALAGFIYLIFNISESQALNDSMITKRVKAWKSKSCPVINWKK